MTQERLLSQAFYESGAHVTLSRHHHFLCETATLLRLFECEVQCHAIPTNTFSALCECGARVTLSRHHHFLCETATFSRLCECVALCHAIPTRILSQRFASVERMSRYPDTIISRVKRLLSHGFASAWRNVMLSRHEYFLSAL